MGGNLGRLAEGLNMNLQELIRGRRTVHSFRAEFVPESVVEEALSLSLWAPNHRMTCPWVYVLAGPESRGKLADLGVELKGATDVKAKAMRDAVLNPSHLLMLGMRKSAEPMQTHEDYATLACSVQIMSLYLWEKGVGSKWSTGGWTKHARTYEILGVDPREVQLEGALMMGYGVVGAPPDRPGLERVLRRVR